MSRRPPGARSPCSRPAPSKGVFTVKKLLPLVLLATDAGEQRDSPRHGGKVTITGLKAP
jgi:hypothetical protein